MYQNRLWLIFIAILLSATFWQTGRAGLKLYQHYRLNTETVAKTVQWQILKVHDERFLLTAVYTYEFKLAIYTGSTTFFEEPYWNEWAAQEAIQRSQSSSFVVWFDPQNPLISSLQKRFPFKECVSALVTFCLLLYFLGLGFYVKQSHTRSNFIQSPD